MASFQYGNLVEQLAVTATAAGTTTLVNTSKALQIFTGTSTQTVKLPVATTYTTPGAKFEIYNESSGALTLQFSDGTAFTDAAGISYTTIAAHTSLIIKLQTNATADGTWAVFSGGGGAGYSLSAPTVQKFLSGSGTYTTPTSPRTPLYLRVEMVGGGGGGSSSGGSAGGSGGTTSFGTASCTGGGGSGGGGTPPTGGTATNGTGWLNLVALSGAFGTPYQPGLTGLFASPGMGGSSPFGGAGAGQVNGGGENAVNGSGSGGGAGGGASGASSGGGGAAGGYLKSIINSPSATYTYSVGAGGSAGSGSGNTGGTGASGIIIVEEYYQ